MTIEPESSALLIVDVQNDFCGGGALAVPDGGAVVGPINRISGFFSHVVATQDWHPLGHRSFASSWAGRKIHEVVESGGIPQHLWPDHCVQGSRGADFHPALELRSVSLILRKGMRPELDSYSALFENDRKTPTGLDAWLRSVGVSRLFLAGLATDYCVFYTALDALAKGYEIVLVEDGVRGVDQPPGSVEAALAELRAKGARFVNSGELEGARK